MASGGGDRQIPHEVTKRGAHPQQLISRQSQSTQAVNRERRTGIIANQDTQPVGSVGKMILIELIVAVQHKTKEKIHEIHKNKHVVLDQI